MADWMRDGRVADRVAFHKDEAALREELHALCKDMVTFWQIGVDLVGNAHEALDVVDGHFTPGSHGRAVRSFAAKREKKRGGGYTSVGGCGSTTNREKLIQSKAMAE